MFKKTDIVIIVAVLLLSAVLALVFYKPSKNAKLCIKVDNKKVAQFSLSENITKTFVTDYGKNTVIIKDGTAYITDSDCPDKTCEKSGKISKVGQSTVCLPHKFVAEVVG